VQQRSGEYGAASASLQQALELYRELGSPLGEADVLNSLGELLSRTTRTHGARGHHTRALAIARDVGAPLVEALALEGIGDSHLQDGNPRIAASYLHQALTIYQRIEAPDAGRVQDTLRNHGLR